MVCYPTTPPFHHSIPHLMDKTIGSAVIGYGGMGSWHVRKQLELKDHFTFQGSFDIEPARQMAA